jgi:hypothetical protein
MPEPETRSKVAISAASRPFPWYCPNCRRKEVRRVTIRYRCQMEHDGSLSRSWSANWRCPGAPTATNWWSTTRPTTKSIARSSNRFVRLATAPPATRRRAPWGRRWEILISCVKTQDVRSLPRLGKGPPLSPLRPRTISFLPPPEPWTRARSWPSRGYNTLPAANKIANGVQEPAFWPIGRARKRTRLSPSAASMDPEFSYANDPQLPPST